MKWDPDRAVRHLEEWTGVSGLTTFTKRFTHAKVLKEFGFALKPGEEGMLAVWELSLITNDGRRYFFGRTTHGAFLQARKALQPKRTKKRKVDRFHKPRSAE